MTPEAAEVSSTASIHSSAVVWTGDINVQHRENSRDKVPDVG